MITKEVRLQRIVDQLKNIELVEKKKNDTFAIYYKKVILFKDIPEEKLSDYLMSEIAACCSRMAGTIEQYLEERKKRTEQLVLELFQDKK
jgi:predicted transcriptional regulator